MLFFIDVIFATKSAENQSSNVFDLLAYLSMSPHNLKIPELGFNCHNVSFPLLWTLIHHIYMS